MEQTIQALGGILLKAIPTVGLLIFLHFYLKYMLFRPLERVMREREELTDGARKSAEKSLQEAARKSEDFEAKMRDARSQVYKEQEDTRRRWLEDQASQLDQARARSEASVKAARQAVAAEADAARKNLAQTSAALAEEIADTLLARRAG